MWRRRMSSGSLNGGPAMEMVSIVWHNPLLTGAVILLLTPPFYPLLVYFSPLLVSTALCVAALLSIGPQMEKLQAQREEADGNVSDRHRGGPQEAAGAWIRVSDIVNADSVTSAAPGLAAQRYEHLAEWSGQSEVRRMWSSGNSSLSAQQSSPQQRGGAEQRGTTMIPSNKSQEDRWAAWVKEYEARPEWNEATAPPSQDGGYAAAVKREQEMRREKECLKLEKDKLKERFKLAAIEAKLQRRHSAQAEEGRQQQQQAHMNLVVRNNGAQPHVGGVEERRVSDVETLERFLFMDTDLSIIQGQRITNTACRTVDSAPPKTEVPAQVLHQLKTAGLGGLARLKVRCSPGTNAAAAHGDAAGAPKSSNSRSSCINASTTGSAPLAEAFARKHTSTVENEVKTGAQEQQVRTATDPSSRVSTPASRGKQLSPGMLHILKTAGLGCNNAKESLEAAAVAADMASDEARKKSFSAGGRRVAAESRESSSDEQLESDNESEDYANEYSELRKHLMENRSQISEPKPVAHNLLQRSTSYKGSNTSETGKLLQREVHQQATQEDTPDHTVRGKLQIASANSQAFQQHYNLKTDCNTFENSNSSSSTHQAKDKGIIALGRSQSTSRQSRLSQLDSSPRNSSGLHSLHKSLSRSSSLRAASISSLDDSMSRRRNSTTITPTPKPLVWKSRSLDSTQEDTTI